MKIMVNGYGSQEPAQEFEILDREALEKIIDNSSPSQIYRQTFEKAYGYTHGGTAYTYLDARDGSIKTSWLGSNTFNHPFDSFYEIWLCSLTTGASAIDLDTPDDLLDDEEQHELRDYSGSIRDYLDEKHGTEEYEKRMENAIDWEAMEWEMDGEKIQEQLKELYSQ